MCLKCHSAAAYASTPPDASPNPTAGTSYWPIAKYTDQALEFNPNNPSYHAVWGGSKASVYGTYVTSAGWSATSSMYCSDCHRPDTVTTPSVRGAHASNTPFMLGGYSSSRIVALRDGTRPGRVRESNGPRQRLRLVLPMSRPARCELGLLGGATTTCTTSPSTRFGPARSATWRCLTALRVRASIVLATRPGAVQRRFGQDHGHHLLADQGIRQGFVLHDQWLPLETGCSAT